MWFKAPPAHWNQKKSTMKLGPPTNDLMAWIFTLARWASQSSDRNHSHIHSVYIYIGRVSLMINTTPSKSNLPIQAGKTTHQDLSWNIWPRPWGSAGGMGIDGVRSFQKDARGTRSWCFLQKNIILMLLKHHKLSIQRKHIIKSSAFEKSFLLSIGMGYSGGIYNSVSS